MDSSQFIRELPEAVIAIDHQGTILKCNPATQKIFGYEPHELIGHNISLLASVPHPDRNDNYLKNDLTTGDSSVIGIGKKLTAVRKDGTAFPIFLTVSRQENTDKPIFIGMIRDLTISESQADELKLLGELIDESICDFFVVSASDLEIQYINRRSLKRLNYEQNQIIGLKFTHLMHEPWTSEFLKVAGILSPGDNQLSFLPSELISRDGTSFPMDLHMQSGVYRGLPIINITGIERTQERETERRLKAVLESAPAYILILDGEFKVKFINRADLVPTNQILGVEIASFLGKDQARIMIRGLKACKHSHQRQEWEISYEGIHGKQWFRCILNYVDANQYILIANDITELKESQALLSISSKLAAVGELSAGISHEINNPLTIVLGNLNAMKKDISCPVINRLGVEKRLETVLAASHRIDEVVKGFRTFARVDKDSDEIVNVHECIESTIQMVKGVFANDEIFFCYEPQQLDLQVRGSFGRLQQILMNLFINAKDELLGQANAIISVNAKRQNSHILIEVRDNGPGVPEAIRARIFDPFFTTKSQGKGTGLGLAISSRLTIEMGGMLKLAISSEPGANFQVLLPALQNAEQKSLTPASLEPEEACYAWINALIVDDESEIREILLDMLFSLGLRNVKQASNGLEALELIKRQSFHLLMTDLKMPVMNGVELIENLDKLQLAQKPKIVVMTGGASSLLISHALGKLGQSILAMILKPFAEHEVETVLKTLKKPDSLSPP
jgi:PAS domain S-box-containing protein